MSNLPALASNTVEQVLLKGDLSGLSAEQRLSYVKSVCESLGLNPLTKPFEYIELNRKLVLYAKRDATDQLRKVHKVSITISDRQKFDDVYVVTAKARNAEGREDESTGAVNIAGLKGESLANAMMKAETKAKRRVTLSICGLGLLDETEVESVLSETTTVTTSNTKSHVPQVTNITSKPALVYTETTPEPEKEPGLEDYVVKIGKKLKGKKLGECDLNDIEWLLNYVKEKKYTNPDSVEFVEHASAYLQSLEAQVQQ